MAQGDRVDQLETKIDVLTGVVGELRTAVAALVGLKTDVAVLTSGMARIERDIAAATGERQNIAKEIGVYGIQLTKFTSTLAGLESAFNALKPHVDTLRQDYSEREGSIKNAGRLSKMVGVIWGVVTTIGALIAGAAVWLSSGGGRHP